MKNEIAHYAERIITFSCATSDGKSESPTAIKAIIPRKSQYKNAAQGRFVLREGKLFFRSGKNIVFINEHFADSAPPEKLIENTIRYDSENS